MAIAMSQTKALPSKWETACRLCSEERNEMLPIFGDEGLQRKVAQKLRACLPVLVYKTDPLPKQICQFCAARLDDAYEFREFCLSVYKNMHLKLLSHKHLESVTIFLDAMRNSPDPCQAQFCKEKPRGPPPLVPLPATMTLERRSLSPADVACQNLQNNNMDALSELPCEVNIEEMNSTLNEELAGRQFSNARRSPGNQFREERKTGRSNVAPATMLENNNCKPDMEAAVVKEEKRTSILEQVLTGSLTINDRKESKPRARLSSDWWCAPCNTYYKSRESLMKHLQLHCPRKYACRKCCSSFANVEDLAEHEGTTHLKVTLDFEEDVQECHQCERTFVSWEMLRQHRLRDHLGKNVEMGTSTWCSPCNRFFPSVEAFKSHEQLHVTSHCASPATVATVPAEAQAAKDLRREHFGENPKSLSCPTCGKVCTQQSALSNHMRTHEPKRHKCDICGRSFGLFIRLAAHRLSEHNQQPTMSPLTASVEQEEALNEEREAREARELHTRGPRTRRFSESVAKNEDPSDDVPPSKRSAPSNPSALKNVARCGICSQWFSDHTTMLTHLQKHSDSQTCKTFNCGLCKKSFKEKWQLFRHEMSHKRGNSDSVHTCTVCEQTFTDSNAYKMHQKGHALDKSYHCSKCNKLFFKEVSLLTHQCTGGPTFAKKSQSVARAPSKSSEQDSSKKYTCSKCSACFATFQSRNSHMRVHAGGQAAPRKSDSRRNSDSEKMPTLTPETSVELTVAPIEPKVEIKEETVPIPVKRTLIRTAGGYRCGVCQSPFVLRELAIAHLRSAHPVMPYQCPYCKKRFTTQYTFTHHIKTEHPDEPEK